jgi:hypothetical protein
VSHDSFMSKLEYEWFKSCFRLTWALLVIMNTYTCIQLFYSVEKNISINSETWNFFDEEGWIWYFVGRYTIIFSKTKNIILIEFLQNTKISKHPCICSIFHQEMHEKASTVYIQISPEIYDEFELIFQLPYVIKFRHRIRKIKRVKNFMLTTYNCCISLKLINL